MSLERIDKFTSRHEVRLFVGLIIAWLAISLPSLLTYPAANSDEAWFGAVAHNLMANGSFGMPIHGDFNGSSEYYIHIGRLYVVALAGWFRIVGVSLFSARAFSIAAALVCALLVWRTGRGITTPAWALLAGALCLFAWKTFYASHRLRPDIWIAAAGAIMLWLYCCYPNKQFLLGFVAAALLLIHVPVVFLLASITAAVAADFFMGEIDLRAASRYALGALSGTGLWAALTFLPDPEAKLQQFLAGPIVLQSSNYFSTEGYSLARGLELISIGFLSTRLGWLELATFAGAISGLAIVKQNRADRALLIFAAIFIALIAISKHMQYYYLVITIPFMSLIIARVAQCLSANSAPWPGLAMAAPLLAAYVAGDVIFSWNSRPISYQRYIDSIRALVPPQAGILADGSIWFEFSDHKFTEDIYLLYAPEAKTMPPKQWIEQAFVSRDITIVLRTERMGTWLPGPLKEEEVLFYSDFAEYLKTTCAQRGVVEDLFWGVDQGGPALKRTEVWECPFGSPSLR